MMMAILPQELILNELAVLAVILAPMRMRKSVMRGAMAAVVSEAAALQMSAPPTSALARSWKSLSASHLGAFIRGAAVVGMMLDPLTG